MTAEGEPRPGYGEAPPLPFDDHLEALSTRECLGYLAAGGLGRVALVIAGIPLVLPVSFVVDEDDVVFLTGSGAKLRAVLADQPIAFEIDHLERPGPGGAQLGWSVLVIGDATASDDPGQVGAARRLGLEPAAPGRQDHVVRLRPRIVTGRRFGHPDTRPLQPREP
jgi:nitroimidazol reductase NimA-like FMN-containing flavoprotein (pyridoxamine 5'-phosphate oxidase superfamily)